MSPKDKLRFLDIDTGIYDMLQKTAIVVESMANSFIIKNKL